jgi:hypothetical protein
MGILSHGESNLSRGENPIKILALQVGGLSWGLHHHTVKTILLKKLNKEESK